LKPTNSFVERLLDKFYPTKIWADNTWPLYTYHFDRRLQTQLGFLELEHLSLSYPILEQVIDFTRDKTLDFPEWPD
jgi:hypothetical protein